MENGYTREEARQLCQMSISKAIELLREIKDTKISQDRVPTIKLEENSTERFSKEMFHNSELAEAVKIAIKHLEREL